MQKRQGIRFNEARKEKKACSRGDRDDGGGYRCSGTKNAEIGDR